MELKLVKVVMDETRKVGEKKATEAGRYIRGSGLLDGSPCFIRVRVPLVATGKATSAKATAKAAKSDGHGPVITRKATAQELAQ